MLGEIVGARDAVSAGQVRAQTQQAPAGPDYNPPRAARCTWCSRAMTQITHDFLIWVCVVGLLVAAMFAVIGVTARRRHASPVALWTAAAMLAAACTWGIYVAH